MFTKTVYSIQTSCKRHHVHHSVSNLQCVGLRHLYLFNFYSRGKTAIQMRERHGLSLYENVKSCRSSSLSIGYYRPIGQYGSRGCSLHDERSYGDHQTNVHERSIEVQQ